MQFVWHLSSFRFNRLQLRFPLGIFGSRTLAIVADDGQATLDGGGSTQLMTVQGADVALANLRLSNGNLSEYGGAIYCEGGTTAMLSCVADSNHATSGGAIYCWGGTMQMRTCVFASNQTKYGGAVYNYEGTVGMQSCVFDSNHAHPGLRRHHGVAHVHL